MATLSSAGSILLVLWVLYYLVKSLFFNNRKGLRLPPGPKPKLLVGNLSDLPPKGSPEWIHWHRHKDLYGPISSLTVLGRTIIILNDANLAFELLEKRSVKHSSRPHMVFSGELVGCGNFLNTQPYSDRFRAYRKNMGRLVGTSAAVSRFDSLHEIEARRFVLRILQNPEDLIQHFRKQAAAITLKIAYGYTVEPHKNDPLVDLADRALDLFSRSAATGTYLVDIVPALKHLPEWFPGAGFKRTAKLWRKTFTDLADRPYAFVRQQMEKGIHEPSYVSRLLEQENLDPEEEFVIKWSSASLYGGAADTTVSSLASFFLAMILYPDVQQKAQEEIDQVVGTDRFPGIADRESLPYVDAIVKEVLRWHPVAPMGLPHLTTEDDICEGYLIPKGTVLMPNIWGFLHDPNSYQDPMTFKPERFLNPSLTTPEPDPHTLSFGFGRRICPGRLVADMSLYLSIALSLAVFNIRKPVDEKTGEEVAPVEEMAPGVISHPMPFQARITPRSPKHEKLVRAVELEHPWAKSDAEVLEKIVT